MPNKHEDPKTTSLRAWVAKTFHATVPLSSYEETICNSQRL
jgi:hypothetical protein